MLDTDRLILDAFSVEDAAFVLLNTPLWLEFIGDRNVQTLADARQYILDEPLKSYEKFGFRQYVVKLKSTGISIGLCGLFKRELLENIDIGFGFLPDYAGSGYGYEATSAVMAYATDQLGLTRITGLTTASNHNSIRLLERPGLRYERKILFRTDGGESLLSGTKNPELYLFQCFLPRFKFGSVDFMPV